MQARQIVANQRWANDRKRIWLVPKKINRTRLDELSRAKSKIMGSKCHGFATSIINGRLKTRFKKSIVWHINHEISGSKHQGRKQNIPLTTLSRLQRQTLHDWRLCSVKVYFLFGQVDFESLRVSQLNAEWLSARNWQHQDWVDDQAADHPLCATSGEYYGIIRPGLQIQLYL